MKKILFGIAAITLACITACNNRDKSSKETDMSKISTDTANTAKMTPADNTSIAEVTHSFNNVDPKLSGLIKTVLDHYLHIKNALVNNSGTEAANGGNAMADAISKVDKSLLTPDQKSMYDDIEDDLKEHAEHIGKNANDIDHQREHFEMMSKDVYVLVRAFGGGQTLYHDHCPMANDNKGAMWLSETKEVKNPYFGGKMNNCVHVVEMIK